MPQVGDLIKITACSNIMSQQACNVFYYVVAAWTGNLTLAEALEVWQDLVPDPLAGSLSAALTPGTVEWRSLDNPTEVATINGGFFGNQGGDLVAPFAAWSFRLFVETGVTRTGWKRIPGVLEASISSGGYIANPTVQTALQSWADLSLVQPVEAGTATDFTLMPVIVGRNPDGTVDITAVNPVVSATVQAAMTTQNTRKIGRGS